VWTTGVFFYGREDLAREARAAAHIENERRCIEVEEFEGTVCHGGLNVLDAGVGRVFAGFDIVVEEVRREDVFGTRHGGGDAKVMSAWRVMKDGQVATKN
jgi:hypothetical protein